MPWRPSTGCSVQLREDKAELPTANNLCTTDDSCGHGAACISGACFFRTGAIDEVLLEVLPDSSSASGGLSFLTVQEHVASGDNARDLEVPVPKRIDGQVEISASALPDNGHCDYLAVGDQPIRIAARVEFARVGAIGGVQVLSLPKTSVTVDTDHGTGQPSNWTFSTYLVPGTYDIYVQPVSTAKCPIPPAILRGVEVTEKSPAWGLPATIDLPAPKHLRGTVERRGGTLVGWQVEVIEPQERRVISTSAVLGPTNGPTSSTNFVIDYQPWVSNPSSKTGIAQAIGDGPLIRLTPPPEMASQAPTVYWDLATIDLDGNGVVSLDLSGLPPPEQQIVVTGQVRGQDGTTSNVRSGVQFFSTSLDGGMGLTANFSQSVTTDEGGNFEARLLAGQYRVVAVPDVASATDAPGLVADHQGSSTQTMSSAHPWAITERQWTATPGSSRLDSSFSPSESSTGTLGRYRLARAGRAARSGPHDHPEPAGGAEGGPRADAGFAAERQRHGQRNRRALRGRARSGGVRYLAAPRPKFEFCLVGVARCVDHPPRVGGTVDDHRASTAAPGAARGDDPRSREQLGPRQRHRPRVRQIADGGRGGQGRRGPHRWRGALCPQAPRALRPLTTTPRPRGPRAPRHSIPRAVNDDTR